MLQQELCPDCGELIAAERMDEEMVICKCGYLYSKAQIDSEKSKNKKASYTIILTSLFMVTAFIHTAKWGGDAVRVTPLEMSRVLGTISPGQALYLGDMSMDKKFYDQAKKMYSLYLESNPEDMDVNQKMGMLLFQTEQYSESLPYFEKYYMEGGDNKDALYSYAKSLTNSNDFEQAEAVLLTLIEREPEVYQITVVQALVDLYIMQDKLPEAKKFVSTLIKSGYEVPAHLQEQKAHIRDLMKKNS